MISFLANSAPAAPSVIIGGAERISQDVRFAFLSSRLAISFPNWVSSLFTSNQSVSPITEIDRIQIFPGTITIQQGEQIAFSAVAYDSESEVINGIGFEWTMQDTGRNFPVRPMPNGNFKPRIFGTYTVTATTNGQQTQKVITVTENSSSFLQETENIEKGNEIPVSSRAVSKKTTQTNQLINEDGWNESNWSSSDDPGNQTGNLPGQSPDSGVGNGNFQISTPVLSLPGRGIDLSLAMYYNSRLWNKSGTQLTYNIDKGFPAPGWSLGFGKIVDMGADNGAMLVDADGTRHSYTGVINFVDGQYSRFKGRTADGTFIDYHTQRDANGVYLAHSYLPDGTVILYGAKAESAVYPTQITDTKGNYITITYRNNQGPAINNITDTMGRVIKFNYDSTGRLLTVTAPNAVGEITKNREMIRLHYNTLNLSYNFASNLTVIAPSTPPKIIDAIYYSGAQTGYWFGDTDSYSSYGMLGKIIEQRGMSWSGTSGQQGTITPGQITKQAVYNYLNAPSGGFTDAPTFDKVTESWADMDTAPLETNYSVFFNSTPRRIEVVNPNGLKSVQYSYNHPNQWDDGLTYRDETFPTATSTTPIAISNVTWEQGNYNSPRPIQMEITDENGQTSLQTITYGTKFNQAITVKEYDYNSPTTLLKETRTEYENGGSYIGTESYGGTYWISGNHIFNLPKAVEIYDGSGNRVSRTENEYDNATWANTPGVIMYSNFRNPNEQIMCWTCGPCREEYNGECIDWEGELVDNTAAYSRGDLTKITNYADAQNLTGAIVENRTYDITGNMRMASSSCCEQTSLNFTETTKYAYPESQTRGSADVNSPHRITTSVTYEYNTGLKLSVTDANGRTSSTAYNYFTVRPTTVTTSTGAYTTFQYDDAAMTITEEIFESGGVSAGKTIKKLNGIGKVRREESLGINNIYDIVETKYNNLGEVWKQSRPFRTGDTPVWSENVFDSQGRTIQTIEPDGSATYAFYNETSRPGSASSLPGSTVRVVDAWGRERWGRYDWQGKLAEVVEPNPNGNGTVSAAGSWQTKYTHDTLGRMTKTEQADQIREFKYDSLGRLTRQKLAEQTATLNDAGQFVGAGGTGAMWSEAFTFDTRSNLTQKTDARGVRTNFSYQISGADDPLNRLQSVSFDQSGPTEANLTIHAAANVSYSYITSGDKTRLSQIRTDGFLTEDFIYDGEGRLSEQTQTVDYRTSYPMKVGYLYDSLNRIKEIHYPAQHNFGSNPRKIVENLYDASSRLAALKVGGQQQAGDIVQDAANQITSIKIGAPVANQITETYTYDSQNGFLTNQKVQKNGQDLLNLSYDYNRNNSVGSANGKTGHLTKITNNLDANKNREYEFDALGRLIKAKGGNTHWQQTYAYDRFGNRTNVTATGVAADNSPIPTDGIPNLSYGTTNNRITTAGFEYDSAGNQTRSKAEDGTWLKYEYDAANRLKIVKKDDGTLLQTFNYGAGNQRLMDYDYITGQMKIIGAGGMIEYTEFSSTVMTWTKSYVYIGSRLLSTATPNGTAETVEYNHPDRLGTRIVTNQSAGTSYEQATLPFGTALAAESSGAHSKRFTSYERSNRTGLDYAVNRTYDNKLGRFTQVDPIGMKAVSLEAPQTLNLYNYCGNDPINHTDPDGLFWGAFKRFFKKVFKVLLFVALVAATALLIYGGVLLIAAGGFLKGLAGGLLFYGASFLGAKIGATIVSAYREWKYRCNVPNFDGLSKQRQEELTGRGVSPERWNSLRNKQKLGYFNIVAAISAAGLSLAGWVIDWALGGIQQDRVHFAAIGIGAVNLFAQVAASNLFSKSNGHEPFYPVGFRFKSLLRSLQLSFSDDGRRLDADVDFFNPSRGIGSFLGHKYEVVSHILGSIFGGTKSNPYNTAFRSSWECL